MFSGEWRYIYKSLAEITSSVDIILPTSVSIRYNIFKQLVNAEDRADSEANKKFPIYDKYDIIEENLEKYTDYNRLLYDRYKLEVFHNFNIQPILYIKIVVEGVKNNWINLN